MERDPIGFAGGVNSYYAANPVGWIDVDGLNRQAVILVGEMEEEHGLMRFLDRVGDLTVANAYARMLSKKGYDVNTYDPRTVEEAQRRMCGADLLVLIGHGSSHGGPIPGVRLTGQRSEVRGRRI